MNIRPILTALLVCLPLSAAGDATDHKPSKFQGTYLLYSGSLDDMAVPNARDAKISMLIRGTLAKEMFQNLGRAASIKGECVDGKETRVAGNLQCSRALEGGSVFCNIGIDIKKGRAIPGAIC